MWSRICWRTVLKRRDTSFTSLGSPAYRLSLESTVHTHKRGREERERGRERGGRERGGREREGGREGERREERGERERDEKRGSVCVEWLDH